MTMAWGRGHRDYWRTVDGADGSGLESRMTVACGRRDCLTVPNGACAHSPVTHFESRGWGALGGITAPHRPILATLEGGAGEGPRGALAHSSAHSDEAPRTDNGMDRGWPEPQTQRERSAMTWPLVILCLVLGAGHGGAAGAVTNSTPGGGLEARANGCRVCLAPAGGKGRFDSNRAEGSRREIDAVCHLLLY